MLLKAAVLEDPDAAVAWLRRTPGVEVSKLDLASYRLLPLLYRTLRAHGIEHPATAAIRAVYERTWLENESRLHHMVPVVRALRDAGIRVMLLKGAALALFYYRDLAVRPMVDFDLLVPEDMVQRSSQVLAALGWTAATFRAPHAQSFTHESGRELDLHWHAFLHCARPHADDDFWRAAVPGHLRDVSVDVLCPADQFLHVCLHGAIWSPSPPLRWIADAHTILRAEPAIDWDRLVRLVTDKRLSLVTGAQFAYLREALGLPIPAQVVRRIRANRVRLAERRECALLGNAPSTWIVAQIAEDVGFYRRLARGQGLRPSALGYARHVQVNSSIDHLWQLPFYAAGVVTRRVWQQLTRSRRLPTSPDATASTMNAE
jgi:hypothetical protein